MLPDELECSIDAVRGSSATDAGRPAMHRAKGSRSWPERSRPIRSSYGRPPSWPAGPTKFGGFQSVRMPAPRAAGEASRSIGAGAGRFACSNLRLRIAAARHRHAAGHADRGPPRFHHCSAVADLLDDLRMPLLPLCTAPSLSPSLTLRSGAPPMEPKPSTISRRQVRPPIFDLHHVLLSIGIGSARSSRLCVF